MRYNIRIIDCNALINVYFIEEYNVIVFGNGIVSASYPSINIVGIHDSGRCSRFIVLFGYLIDSQLSKWRIKISYLPSLQFQRIHIPTFLEAKYLCVKFNKILTLGLRVKSQTKMFNCQFTQPNYKIKVFNLYQTQYV